MVTYVSIFLTQELKAANIFSLLLLENHTSSRYDYFQLLSKHQISYGYVDGSLFAATTDGDFFFEYSLVHHTLLLFFNSIRTICL